MSNDIQPEIRFPGFTEDWEQLRLGEYLVPYNEVTTENNQYPVLTSSRKGLFFQKDYYDGNQIASEDNTGYNIVPRGYFTYRHMSDDLIFKFNINDIADKGIVSTLYPVFTTTSDLDSKYLQYQLNGGQEFKRFAILQKQGGSRTYMYLSKLKNMFISIPKYNEQIKISTFFKQLDDTIALHQRKLDLLKETKKGFLQKMFPKNGAKVPEIRFSGFTGDWEQRKLDEVSSIYDGTHQTPKYQDEGVMFLSVENIKTLTSNKFISRDAFESEFKIRPQKSDVLMTRIGDIGTANVVESDEDLAYYVSLALFKSENLNPYFLKASIHAPFVQDQIWKRTLHIAFPKKINKNEIGQVPINIPKFEEQVKIGKFFQEVDKAITLHQRKLDLLKETKKGFLQKMFV